MAEASTINTIPTAYMHAPTHILWHALTALTLNPHPHSHSHPHPHSHPNPNQVLGDTLTLLDGEQDEEPYGLFPPLMGQGGLTPAAEMWNGRLAMLGLIALVSTSVISGLDILDVIDVGTGGLLKAAP